MTPTEADGRLAAAERSARGYGDTSFYSAVATADPGEVRGACDETSADALGAEFLTLADGMVELDVDAQCVGDALDMVSAEAEVAEAARQVKRAAAALAEAEQALEDAQARAASASDEQQAAADAAVAAAEDDVRAAEQALAAAKRRLAEALAAAADLAASMRDGLRRRHRGIQDAAEAAPVLMAGRNFYTDTDGT